jgi:hypothetical protein
LVIRFIAHWRLVTTVNYSAIADSHNLQFTSARTKSSKPPQDVAWRRIAIMSSSSVLMSFPAGYSPRVLTAVNCTH